MAALQPVAGDVHLLTVLLEEESSEPAWVACHALAWIRIPTAIAQRRCASRRVRGPSRAVPACDSASLESVSCPDRAHVSQARKPTRPALIAPARSLAAGCSELL